MSEFTVSLVLYRAKLVQQKQFCYKLNELQILDMAVGKSRALKILVEQLSKFQTNTKMAVAKSRPFTVLVEGNIGCGKTTFLQHFAKVRSQMLNT